MKNDFVSSGRAVSDMKAHLVLVTKYRKKVINQEMLKRLGEIVDNLCTKWDCKLIEFNGEPDHVHLLFQYYPQLELPKFITNLKSVSSRRLRAEFSEQINQVYFKAVLWSESYFIASCGGVSVSVLKKYIENQEEPHI
ncbi:MAG: IS200/IS605 family transposase [Okeania sp. SIO3H1]|uniref:IS200/IS605 family transposase n=1 Tax=Okeania sp. SIO1I7 TaxID=2607772 RepID=UPI0013CBA68E|nr:IS200/IS605 family transposase [Okeania sp. SIO1I7]NEN91775.1 IS200/IS605 family transposase [Okeania sp. SIO3H1]NET29723.1 IS200/IS605 family transposase [Okeania sp. SIO1I7]